MHHGFFNYNLNYIVLFFYSRFKPLLDLPFNEPRRKGCMEIGEGREGINPS
jgi:hypothetical protein